MQVGLNSDCFEQQAGGSRVALGAGGALKDAVGVCEHEMRDPQLAFFLCSLLEGPKGPLERDLVSNNLIPGALAVEGESWVALENRSTATAGQNEGGRTNLSSAAFSENCQTCCKDACPVRLEMPAWHCRGTRGWRSFSSSSVSVAAGRSSGRHVKPSSNSLWG